MAKKKAKKKTTAPKLRGNVTYRGKSRSIASLVASGSVFMRDGKAYTANKAMAKASNGRIGESERGQ